MQNLSAAGATQTNFAKLPDVGGNPNRQPCKLQQTDKTENQAHPPPDNKRLLTYHLDTTSPDLDTFFRSNILTFAKNKKKKFYEQH